MVIQPQSRAWKKKDNQHQVSYVHVPCLLNSTVVLLETESAYKASWINRGGVGVFVRAKVGLSRFWVTLAHSVFSRNRSEIAGDGIASVLAVMSNGQEGCQPCNSAPRSLRKAYRTQR